MPSQTGSIDLTAQVAANTNAKDYTDSVEIGGTNRLINTADPSAAKPVMGANCPNPTVSGGNLVYASGVGTFTTSDASKEQYIRFTPATASVNTLANFGFEPGTDLVFSGYVKTGISNGALTARAEYYNSGWKLINTKNLVTGEVRNDGKAVVASGSVSEWKRFEVHYDIPDGMSTVYISFQMYAASGGSIAVGDTFSFKQLKLESGNKATAWTQAPEDVEADAQAKADAVQENLDNLEIGGTNLLPHSSVIAFSTSWTIDGETWTGTAGKGAGLKFASTLFTVGENYVLSFDFQKTSGTLSAIGGHSAGFSRNELAVDGVVVASDYYEGHTMADDTLKHHVVLKLTYNGDQSDNNLYIQPNRGAYQSSNGSTFKISNIKLEKGNKPTDWSPAPEDVEADAQAKADAVQANLDNLEIGGRNLLQRTADLDNTAYWQRSAITSITKTQADPEGGKGAFLITPSSDAWYLCNTNIHGLVKEVGETYTFSIWLKAASATTCNICARYVRSEWSDATTATATSRKTVSLTTSWQKFTLTGILETAQDGSNMSKYGFWIGQKSNVAVYAYHPKLEKGGKSTDWSPAPEDAFGDGVEYIAGTQTGTTASWTGITKDATLVTGKTIAYRLPQTSASNVTLNLTLNGGNDSPVRTTGAKAVYVGTTRMSTHFAAGAVINMTYDGSNWRATSIPNTNNVDRRQHNNQVKAAADLSPYSICVGTAAGYKTASAGVTFDLDYPVLYLNANFAKISNVTQDYAIASGGTTTAMYEAMPSVSLNYTVSEIQASLTPNKIVFLKGTVSGNTFTISAAPFLTTDTPNSADGYAYMPIGRLGNNSSATVNALFFATSRDLYCYKDGAFGPVSIREASAAAKTATNYITDITNDGIWVTPSDAKPSSGQAVSTTRGWHIADAIELFHGAASTTSAIIKAWADTVSNTVVPKIRVGLEDTCQLLTPTASTFYVDCAKRAEITDSGLTVYDGNAGSEVDVASFGATSRIGSADSMRTVMTPSEFTITDPSGNTVTHIRSSNTHDGRAQIDLKLVGNGATVRFYTDADSTIDSIVSCCYDDGDALEMPTLVGSNCIEFSSPPAAKAFTVTYRTLDPVYRLTFGTRKSDGLTGRSSTAIGIGNVAAYQYATAMGRNNQAISSDAYAIGRDNIASDYDSYAIGRGLKASSRNQTVIGRYNEEDASGTYSFVVGGGTSDGARRTILGIESATGLIRSWNASGSSESGFRTERLNTQVGMLIGVGQGGVNHGIHSSVANKWMIRVGDVTVNSGTEHHVFVDEVDMTGVDWTTLPLDSSKCEAYSSAQVPKFKRWGNVVNVRGSVKPKASYSASADSAFHIGALPAGSRPDVTANYICQGSGTSTWMLEILNDGNMYARRVRNEGGWSAFTTSAWFTFDVTFMV